MTRVIVYPIFLLSRNCTKDPFWEQVFEKLAYNEPPKGIHFAGETLISTLKKKEFNYSFANKEPEQIYDELYNILIHTFGMVKSETVLSKKRVFENFCSSLRKCEDNWGTIRQKNIKESLILIFVSRAVKQFHLSETKAQELYYFIHTGIQLKIFQDRDIYLAEGNIQAIDGVEFSERDFKITRSFQTSEGKADQKSRSKIIHPKELWSEYLSKNG